MVYEQDYVMRIIHEMVRTLMKMIFNIDIDKNEYLQIDAEVEIKFARLSELVDSGAIDKAEDELTEMLDKSDLNGLQLALMFYEYLNSKNSEFLETHDFSRKEILEGLRDVTDFYGYGDMLDIFTQYLE